MEMPGNKPFAFRLYRDNNLFLDCFGLYGFQFVHEKNSLLKTYSNNNPVRIFRIGKINAVSFSFSF